MADHYKMSVKLPGGFEFTAEGPQESVDAQYKLWLQAVEAAQKHPPGVDLNSQGLAAKRHKPQMSADIEEVVGRVYRLDKDKKTLSLTVLPKTDDAQADALLLLLYGYSHFFHEESVLGGKLMTAANVSGIQLSRVDKVLERHKDKLTTAGLRRGRTYGLNNPGKVFAVSLLERILDG
jgi:hypothetical protein